MRSQVGQSAAIDRPLPRPNPRIISHPTLLRIATWPSPTKSRARSRRRALTTETDRNGSIGYDNTASIIPLHQLRRSKAGAKRQKAYRERKKAKAASLAHGIEPLPVSDHARQPDIEASPGKW